MPVEPEPAACQCPVAGWCDRHRRVKTPHLHRLCREDVRYRGKWDRDSAAGVGVQEKPEADLSFTGKARRLTAAVRKWIAAGRPVRTPERVQEIFDTICKPCQHFIAGRKGRGKCGLCGCGLRRKGLIGKIQMQTESCPAGKWTSEYDEHAEHEA